MPILFKRISDRDSSLLMIAKAHPANICFGKISTSFRRISQELRYRLRGREGVIGPSSILSSSGYRDATLNYNKTRRCIWRQRFLNTRSSSATIMSSIDLRGVGGKLVLVQALVLPIKDRGPIHEYYGNH